MIITQTPLRISFLGGGTDFSGFYRDEPGAVLSCTIDKYIFVIAKRRYDKRLRAAYTRTELVMRPEELEHELVREALLATGIRGGLEIATMGDIPSRGSGLGSSSTVSVGLLHALWLHSGHLPTRSELAEGACRIEIDALRRPVGKQDQYAAAFGGLRTYTFGPERVEVGPLLGDAYLMRRLSESLMLYFTGVTRSARAVLARQVSATEELRGHLRAMKCMVDQGASALARGDIDAFGTLVDESWRRKRELAPGITNPDIDRMIDTAVAAGALGCKVCGAGGGGFLLVVCRPEQQHSVRRAMRGFAELSFDLETEGTRVLANVARAPYWQTRTGQEGEGS